MGGYNNAAYAEMYNDVEHMFLAEMSTNDPEIQSTLLSAQEDMMYNPVCRQEELFALSLAIPGAPELVAGSLARVGRVSAETAGAVGVGAKGYSIYNGVNEFYNYSNSGYYSSQDDFKLAPAPNI